jgi:DNA-binding transcriptional ArsR family regulator
MDVLLHDKKSMEVSIADMEKLRVLFDPTRWRIAQELAVEPAYSAAVAKKLKLNEQVVYYHIRQLEKAGLIKVARTEEKQGAVARYYSLVSPAFALIARQEWSAEGVRGQPPSIFHDFIVGGRMNCRIIVGSPDPHGPHKARARDCYFGLDLALFMGSLCNAITPVTKLDTEIREKDLEDNLICIGGPVTNMVTARFINEMPLYFKTTDGWAICSKLSNAEYIEDAAGLIIRIPNPLKEGKHIIIIAGKGIEGTKAAVIALTKHPDADWRNLHDKKTYAKVVEGIDVDGDGVIDDVEFRE